jgi:hypothetical protein
MITSKNATIIKININIVWHTTRTTLILLFTFASNKRYEKQIRQY